MTSSKGSWRTAEYVPALDGLRGLAILLVVVHHAVRRLPYQDGAEAIVHRFANAGWIGVDLFFVLSGFLITGILLDAKGRGGYFRVFYLRRVLRIMPLYLVFVALVVWIAPALALATPDEASAVRDAQGWYWAHMVNVLIARQGWGNGTWHSGHLWSLSLEEQFYLLWPVVVRAFSRRALIRIAIVCIALATVLRPVLAAMSVSWTALYVLPTTRIDTLALGAILAVWWRDPSTWAQVRRWSVPVAGAASCVVAVLAYRDGILRSALSTQVIGYAAVALLCGAAVTMAAEPSLASGVVRFCSWRPMRALGQYSYGLYVWHAVVVALLYERVFAGSRLETMGGSHLPGYAIFTLTSLALSLGVALLSWHGLEAPFLTLKSRVRHSGPPGGARTRGEWVVYRVASVARAAVLSGRSR